MTKTAFAVIFTLFGIITLFITGFPPAQMLREYLKIPAMTSSLWGIPITSLLDGIINGIFWVIIAAIIYGVAQYSRRVEPLLPMPVPPRLATPPLENPIVDYRTSLIPPAFTITLKPSSLPSSELVRSVRPKHAPNRRKALWTHEVITVRGHPQNRYRDIKTGRFIKRPG